jgi:protein-serine/threonine kinase
VRCFGASFDGVVFWAVLGLCPGGTLQGLLQASDSQAHVPIAWGKQYQIAIDVAYALKYLHQNGICHRDIKSENILLDSRGRALIADLGCAQSDNLVQEEESAVVASGPFFVCSRVYFICFQKCLLNVRCL